jgi:hypothetical protein
MLALRKYAGEGRGIIIHPNYSRLTEQDFVG